VDTGFQFRQQFRLWASVVITWMIAFVGPVLIRIEDKSKVSLWVVIGVTYFFTVYPLGEIPYRRFWSTSRIVRAIGPVVLWAVSEVLLRLGMWNRIIGLPVPH
jgi:hypothetical protein